MITALLRNERKVIESLLQNARTPDSHIAKNIGITTQAVGKIRRKLEKEDIIQGYNLRLNPHAIGLNVVTVVTLLTPQAIIEHENEFRKTITKDPNLIDCYRLMQGAANLLLVFGFKTLEEAESYFKIFQQTYPGTQMINMQTTTWDTVWKNTKKDAYQAALNTEGLTSILQEKTHKQ